MGMVPPDPAPAPPPPLDPATYAPLARPGDSVVTPPAAPAPGTPQ